MTSTAADRARSAFDRWLAALESPLPLQRFRVAFTGIWLSYDALDLVLAGTERCHHWGAVVLGREAGLMALQLGLVAVGLMALLGVRTRMALGAAVVLRLVEAFGYFSVNDFFYFTTTGFLLAMVPWQQLARGELAPAWPRTALRIQTGWIYFATGLLKLNPNWLSGAQLHTRTGMLMLRGWPFPEAARSCLASLPCVRALSILGVGSELALAVLLLSGRGRWLAVLLALGVHGFGAVGTNVWFFGASMVAQVYFAMWKPKPRPI